MLTTIKYYIIRLWKHFIIGTDEILIQKSIMLKAPIKKENPSTQKINRTIKYLQSRINEILSNDIAFKLNINETWKYENGYVMVKRIYCDFHETKWNIIRCSHGMDCFNCK